MNWFYNLLLKQALGWADNEIKTNGNRIKVAIAGTVVAGLVKLVSLLNPSFVQPLGPAFQQGADWLANVILGAAASLIASWTVRAPGAGALPAPTDEQGSLPPVPPTVD